MAASVNASEVSLYYIKDNYKEKIGDVPKNYNKSFQLRVSGASNVRYTVKSGDSATVSSSGLVEPKATVWYWYGGMGSTFPMPEYGEPTSVETDYEEGDTVVEVRADNQIFNVTVHVNDYAPIYAGQVMDDYIKQNVKSGMSDYEKIELCAKLPASYEYSGRYSGATSMIIFGGGDCWASTDLIIKLAKKMGFDAWARNGNRDWGAGSGHMNAMVQAKDGNYYEVEAGYDEPAPRYYSVTERTSLFSYRYYNPIEVYQYDGKEVPETVVVPSTIDGKKVDSIGENFLSYEKNVKKVVIPEGVTEINEGAFFNCENLESINLPASLESLSDVVFGGCSKLTDIKSSSPNFPAENGVIYNKDKSVVLYASAVSNLYLPSSVKEIGFYALRLNRNIENFEINDNISLISDGAFAGCSNLKSINLSNGKLQKIGNHAFAECAELSRVIVPSSVTEIGDGAFLRANKLTQVTVLNKNCVIEDSKYVFPEDTVLYGYAGSTLEAYAKTYNRRFVSIDNCRHTSTVDVITKSPTCLQEGTKDVRCLLCDSIVKSNISIPKVNHSEIIDVYPIDATCTAAGRTKGSHCSVCNQTLSVSKTTAPLGHSYEWQVNEGMIVKMCNNCGDIISRLPFKDLSGIDYRQYSDYIEYTSVNNQFITGTNPPERTLFSPTAPITRAMFVTILYRMAGEPYTDYNPYRTSPFTDITDTSAYYYDAACWALKNGITTETTFKPFDNVSREQTASFLFRYAKDNGKLGDSAYKNVNLAAYPDYNSVHGWAVEAMQWANYNGMITGTQQGYINPQGATQRIHATKILYGFGKTCNIGNFV